MDVQLGPRRSADAIIGALADRQHGAVARWQLLARGITAEQIAYRIKAGRLRVVHRGVYLVGHVATAPLAYEAAAVLAFRSGAVISHRSAAKILGLLDCRGDECWVTTPRGDSSRPGLIVRKATLEPCDITSVERIRTTTAARTILDCAAVLPKRDDDRLEIMCAQAKAHHDVGVPELWQQIERNPGKPGVPRLAKLIEKRVPRRPKRELERRLLKLIRASDLPEPEVNVWLEGAERDLAWRDQRLVVEADSYTFHSDPRTWARDIGKTNDLQLRGYVILRFTWFDVTERPQWVLAEIRRALALRAERPPASRDRD
jgi:very-short-patch-repair endonuclease